MSVVVKALLVLFCGWLFFYWDVGSCRIRWSYQMLMGVFWFGCCEM